jgi:hypothetical protein
MTAVRSAAMTFGEAEVKAKAAADAVVSAMINSTVKNVGAVFDSEAERRQVLADVSSLTTNAGATAVLESAFVSWLASSYILLPPREASFVE